MSHHWLDAVLGASRGVHGRVGRAALATIVSARGSTPRRPGARMVIYPDGSLEGTVGGGCGEAEVRKAALDVIDTGRPKLIVIDLAGTFDDEEEVCGGRVEVFIEPLDWESPGERGGEAAR